MTRIGMVSLGCPKNQVDAERMLALLLDEGYELAYDAALSDVVIVNTCGFIQSAKEEAIETILEFCTLKKEGRIKAVVVTGCLAERYREEILSEIPEVDAVVGIGKNDELADIIRQVYCGEQVCTFGDKADLCFDEKRILSTPSYLAYLKIAEGCDNRCTYCAIPSIRGPFRSRSIESIVSEAKSLAERGVKELVLIAQDTTRYGEDLYGEGKLAELLRELAKIEKLKWIRTLYLYPERITDELIDVFASEERVVPYMDIPIQHCNKDILRKMNRRGDEQSLIDLIQKIRQRVPDVILRTTLIAGFPSESEEQFEELCKFVQKARFDRLGCFAYSAEEGTAAAEFDGQIDDDVKERRAEIVYDEQSRIALEKSEEQIGKTLEIVCEGFDRYAECYFGRSYMDAPEIDGKIFFTADVKPTAGEFIKVKITDTLDYDLLGERV
ncbi:MAG: 30S ribosomal protein S12 methylthiotransferase RimO [Ruminococcus sp.]|nr:30S ribosomal protein S12 methylthiotransferase RimO [Ruminococcus sp.]